VRFPRAHFLDRPCVDVAYDYLLEMEVPPGVQLVSFTDNLAIVGVAKMNEILENLMNPAFERIDDWMTSRVLQLTHQKTEADMLMKKWSYKPPLLSIGGTHIQSSKHIRYLGVIIDSRLSFIKHAETVAKKESKSAIDHKKCF